MHPIDILSHSPSPSLPLSFSFTLPPFLILLHPLSLSHSTSTSQFLDTEIYLTRGWKDSQAFAIMLSEGDERDAITGLHTKTNFGRPEWNKVFDSISLAHPK